MAGSETAIIRVKANAEVSKHAVSKEVSIAQAAIEKQAEQSDDEATERCQSLVPNLTLGWNRSEKGVVALVWSSCQTLK